MVFTGDDSQYVEMNTIGGLEEGDISTILLTGENGKAMRPLAIGSAGSIDRIRSTVESAETLAQQAEAVATATGQYFWTGDDGVHVTEVTQEEWNDEDSPSYHSGANVIINALGQLFRDGINRLMALLPSQRHSDTFIGDGSTDTFTLTYVPTKVSRVFSPEKQLVNGTDYEIQGDDEIRISPPLGTGDKVGVSYVALSDTSDSFTADGMSAQYTLSEPASPDYQVNIAPSYMDMYRGSVTGNVVSFAFPPSAGRQFTVTYRPLVYDEITGDGTTVYHTLSHEAYVASLTAKRLRRTYPYTISGSTITIPDDLGYGVQLVVTYRTGKTGLYIFDGEGNEDENVIAEFTEDKVRIGGEFADSGQSTARVQFFGDSSALTDLTAEHYVNQTVEPMVSHGLALSSTTTDEDLPDSTSRTVTGNVEVWEQIYNDGNDYSDEVDVSLTGATTNRLSAVSVGAKAVESTGNVFSRIVYAIADTLRLTYGTGEQTSVNDIPLQQAIVGLTQPSGTYIGTNNTTTATSSGWRITWFNTRIAGTAGNFGENYYTFSNGVVTLLKACVLEFSGVMNWTDSVAGNRGFGIFKGSSTVSSGREWSAFQMFPSGTGTRKSVVLPPIMLPCTAGEQLAIGRYEQTNAVYVNGANFSWITIRVVEDRSSGTDEVTE